MEEEQLGEYHDAKHNRGAGASSRDGSHGTDVEARNDDEQERRPRQQNGLCRRVRSADFVDSVGLTDQV